MHDILIRELRGFLADDKAKVLALHGEWGAGKTYLWREFLKANRCCVKQKSYAYASLFGLKSVDELRAKLLAEFSASTSRLPLGWSRGSAFESGKRFLRSFSAAWSGPLELALNVLQNRFMHDCLVCIDDIERREIQLTAHSLLGFVSELKEVYACKIVLIYNSERIETESKRDFNLYREKVTDREITFSPTIIQNLQHVWNSGLPHFALEVFSGFGINNIRVMQKVKTVLSALSPIVGKYPILLPAFERNCAILSILYYCFPEKINIDDVDGIVHFIGFGFGDGGKSDDSREFYELIGRLGYQNRSDRSMIIDYLKNGLIDESTYQSTLKSLEAEWNGYSQVDWWQQIRSKYLTNFSTRNVDFVAELTEFMRQSTAATRPDDVYACFCLLQNFAPAPEWQVLLEKYLDDLAPRIQHLPDYDLSDVASLPEMKQLIVKRIARNEASVPLPDAMRMLMGRTGFSPEAFRHLQRFSEDDFFHWLESDNTNELLTGLSNFGSRFERTETPEIRAVRERLTAALRRIEMRSPLDKYKVERFIRRQPPPHQAVVASANAEDHPEA